MRSESCMATICGLGGPAGSRREAGAGPGDGDDRFAAAAEDDQEQRDEAPAGDDDERCRAARPTGLRTGFVTLALPRPRGEAGGFQS